MGMFGKYFFVLYCAAVLTVSSAHSSELHSDSFDFSSSDQSRLDEARKLYRRAKKYEYGTGVEIDLDKAFDMYMKAAGAS
ncbi:MAG: SEL1-like repeat protein [Rhodospirillales bacterium]|nr:SEL1-like repeat protein [Rhodospirillales bacterium]MCB9997074.1 SEL1-like repeat protein [Rhodospirillales bacterium]